VLTNDKRVLIGEGNVVTSLPSECNERFPKWAQRAFSNERSEWHKRTQRAKWCWGLEKGA